MPVSATDYANGMLEKVRPQLQSMIDMHEGTSSIVKKGTNVMQVSDRLARIPILSSYGGDFGTVSLDGGAMGNGSGPQIARMELTYTVTKIGYEITLQSQFATDSTDKAVADATKLTMGNAIKEFGVYDDILFHNQTGNQGVLGTATAVDSTSATGPGGTRIYTMDAAFSVQLFRLNMPVEIYDSTLTTQKTASNSPDSLPRVTKIDIPNRQITITLPSTFTGTYTPAATDRFLIQGIKAGSVVSKNGLYLFNSTVTTGSLLNMSRDNYPEINSNIVTATGSLIPLYGLLLKHRIQMRRGAVPKDLTGLTHPAQQAAIASYGLTWSTWNRGSSDKMIDLMPGIGDDTPFCGINFKADTRADRTRMDVISPSTWGRVRLKDTDFFEIDGRKIFEKRSSNGSVMTAMVFFITLAENYYCADPGSQGAIVGLPVTAGY